MLWAAGQLVAQGGRGFPDGYISPLDRALRGPHLALAAGILAVSAYGLWRRGGKPGPWLLVLVGLCVLDALGLDALGRWWGLDGGGGG